MFSHENKTSQLKGIWGHLVKPFCFTDKEKSKLLRSNSWLLAEIRLESKGANTSSVHCYIRFSGQGRIWMNECYAKNKAIIKR